MFIGHFAVGFAAKRAVPQVSLAALVLAALFADILWPVLVLAGVESVEIAPGATVAMEEMAHSDFLTGLLNRRGVMVRMETERKRLVRSGGKLGVLIVDLDLFKRINDNWGHAVGDLALVEIARVLKDSVRTYDGVARWGGEEFLVGMFDLSCFAELEAVANNLLNAVRQVRLDCHGVDVSLTYSIGGILADATVSLDEIIKQADDALYRAKNEGRDRAVLANFLPA